MKKLYIKILAIVFFMCFINTLIAQSVLNPSDTLKDYDPLNPPVEPIYGQIGKWIRTKSLLWNSDSYKAYIYEGSCFRLKFPKTYDPIANDGKKYPIAIVFHGGGEAGPVTDNETDLYHGGQNYMSAVDSGIFDGYVLFMQSQGTWGSTSYNKIIDILNYMIINNKLDPFHISVNGLSAGGQACWDMLINYPAYTSSSIPMSNISIAYKDSSIVNKIKYTPVWDLQGELDGSPAPSTAQQVRDAIDAAGGNFRYSEYPDVGHNTWDKAFAEPDFFPFMERAYSSNPWVLFGRTGFCNADSIHLTIGVATGFDDYEWRRDSVVIPGENSNSLQVDTMGTYDARVLRNGIWSDWSHIPVKIQITPPTITPSIEVSGLMSNVIPAPDGNTYVNLEVPGDEFVSFQWKKPGTDSILDTSKIFKVTQPGKYIASAMVQYGCSTIFSPEFNVINALGSNTPDAAENLTATATSSTEILLNWENNPHPVHNESWFEIYRSCRNDSNYSFIAKVPADTLHFMDTKLSPGIAYYYTIRAINDSGSAPLSNTANTLTPEDNIHPQAPADLQIVYATNSSIKIKWAYSSDNVGVDHYDIYINGAKTYTTTTNTFIANALQQGKQYSFFVKAVDSSGNNSPQSNIASSPAILKGLFYKYYEGNWSEIPDFTSLIPVKSGVSSNADISECKRPTQFAFEWNGYIKIPATGTYTFSITSDDGSKLWVNTTNLAKKPLVGNDNIHNRRTKSGKITLAKGYYLISIQYFQAYRSKSLEIYWSNPGYFGDSLKHKIEDQYFTSDSITSDSTLKAPGNLDAARLAYNKIKVSWSDSSNNETGFQIYRSLKSGKGYSIIFTTTSNSTEYLDSGLMADTKYYYKINAVNNYSTSAFTDFASAITLKMPAPPKAPNDFNAKALSSSSIKLTWKSTDSNGVNFVISRSAIDSFNFKEAALLPNGATTYIDTGLYGKTNYFYKINAVNTITESPDKPAVNAKTKNNKPFVSINFIPQAIPATIQTILNVTASDPDDDSLIFETINLPVFASVINHGNNTASLIFNPTVTDTGNYNQIQVYVRDGSGGTDTCTFNLTVNNNFPPVINPIEDLNLDEGEIKSISLSATDQNENDSIAWEINNAPEGTELKILNNRNAELTFKPGYASAGNYTIKINANDGYSDTAFREFHLTVNDKNPNTIVYLRFRDQDSVAGAWNNINSVATSHLKDSFNNITNIGLTLQTGWFATWHEGPQTGNNSGIFPDAVMRDYYYFGTLGGPDTVVGKITGLDTSRYFDISFYGASNWVGAQDNGNTVYTIGNQSISLYVQNNTSQTAGFAHIKPGADSSITFKMTKDSNAISGYINAIVVKSYYSDTLKPATPTLLTAINISGNKVQLSWKDNAYNESNYSVYRTTDTTMGFTLLSGVLAANSTSFIDSAVLGNTKYYYKVNALNNKGNSGVSNIVSIQTDDRAPILNPIANIYIKNNKQQTVNVSAIDDSTDHIILSASNLPTFVSFTDNGNGTGSFSINPDNNITGLFENITLTATDNKKLSASTSFNIIVGDKNTASVYINFTDTSLAPTPWNNFDTLPVANAVLSNLYDDNDSLTTISLKLLNGFQGIHSTGMQTGTEKVIFPDAVIRYGLYEGGSGTDSIQISGLLKYKKYNFVFFNSHDDGSNGNTVFSIDNKKIKSNAAYNLNKTVQINGIMPDDSGRVLITVSKDSLASFAYLNALIIQSYTKKIGLVSPSGLTVTSTSRNSIGLQWGDRSGTETNYEIWRADDSLGNYTLLRQLNANTTSYTDTNLAPGTTYFYIVRATSNDEQSGYSNAIAGTTCTQAVYINFTDVNIAGSPWNNTMALPEPGYEWDNLYDDAGIPSSMGLKLMTTFAGLYSSGMVTGDNSSLFSDKVKKDNYGLFTGGKAQLKITGLNLNMKYDFTFFASSQATGDVNSVYEINNQKVILNASLNVNGTVTIYNISPDNNGEVSILVSPNSITSQFGLIGALIIREHPVSGFNVPIPNQSLIAQTTPIINKSDTRKTQIGNSQTKVFTYPNPFINRFTISFSVEKNENILAELYDINGKLVRIKSFDNINPGKQSLQFEVGKNIVSGIYLLKIIFKDSKNIEYINIIKE